MTANTGHWCTQDHSRPDARFTTAHVHWHPDIRPTTEEDDD